MNLLTQYWPWWLGALALSFVAVGYFYSLGIPCGVSGVFGRVAGWREELEARNTEMSMARNAAQVQEQMMAEALAALQELPEEERKQVEAEMRAAQAQEAASAPAATTVVRPHPAAHLAFLASIAVGGLLAALSSGQWGLLTDMGATYSSFFGSGSSAWLILFVGGMCVGVGTQMAGGCTLGHGITGNSSLQIGSFTATAAFFATAVVASFIFKALL
jgi:uncharacterized membrane protein YedE/YeeE